MSNLVVRDVPTYLMRVFQMSKNNTGTTCYRGQSDIGWELKPSVMRNLKPNAENKIISELLLEAPEEFGRDKSMFDKLVRAQHYGLPTRLVDVSLNPLVALYFACKDEDCMEKDGVVQLFDFNEDRVKYADSDAVSLICNLTQLSDDEREQLKKSYKKYKDETITLDGFRKRKEISRLIHFVGAEKPYFLNVIKPVDLFRYFLVHPKKNNRRVIAQSGVFIAAGLLNYSGVEKSLGFDIKRIIIKKGQKPDILAELDKININSRTMFPEIEEVSKYIKKNWEVEK